MVSVGVGVIGCGMFSVLLRRLLLVLSVLVGSVVIVGGCVVSWDDLAEARICW